MDSWSMPNAVMYKVFKVSMLRQELLADFTTCIKPREWNRAMGIGMQRGMRLNNNCLQNGDGGISTGVVRSEENGSFRRYDPLGEFGII